MLQASDIYIHTCGPTCKEHCHIYGTMGPHALSMEYTYMDPWAHMLGALSIFVGPLLGALGLYKIS